jgi:lipoprotein-anchoring transpeptidase ErfK/SrfK
MRINRLIALLTAATVAMLTLGQVTHADLLIKIDKTAQRMTVTAAGKPVHNWPVSTGRSGYDTPSGRFKPFRMEIDHYSKEWDDAPMPYSIFFTKSGNAVHGTYEQRHLGRAVSHGCVRLSVRNAATFVGTGEAGENGQHHCGGD